MKKFTLTILTAAALPGLSLAQDNNNFNCSNGDLQRRVEIVYETGVTVPCEVHYYKDTEAPGERQVLWRALQQEGYCEEQTRQFITQLASWGWDCTQSVDAAPEMDKSDMPDEPAEADDTEALAPVDEVEGTADS
jgi:hypothetical protein